MRLVYFSYFGLTYEFDQMDRYLDIVHDAFHRREAELAEYVEAVISKLSEKEKQRFLEVRGDDFVEISMDFPRLLGRSFVVTWHSLVEQQLLTLCKEMNLKLLVSIDDNRNSGKGIFRAYHFLREGRKYRIEDSLWEELQNINKLRNIIVHQGPSLKISLEKPEIKSVPYTPPSGGNIFIHVDKSLFAYLKKHALMEEDYWFAITPSVDYCKHLVQLGRVLFGNLARDLGSEL